MGAVSVWHLAIVLGVVVLLFGSKKLPEVARSLGTSARILKSEAAAMKNDGPAEAGAYAESGRAEPDAPSRIIQAAPGDVATARPVADEQGRTAQG